MASTNKTPNYNLPQWVETDPVEMADFNQAMSDIDSNLNLVDNTVAAHLAENVTYTIRASRDISLFGNQIIDMPFKPKSILCIAALTNTYQESIGVWAENDVQNARYNYANGSEYRFRNNSLVVFNSGANAVYGDIVGVSNNSITINWNLWTGTPSGTVNFILLCNTHGGV